MKLAELLQEYPADVLDRLAADKVDEVAGLRLPRPVVVQEVERALGSLSYVAKVLAPSRPPTYAILRLLLDAPENRLPGAGFRQKVCNLTEQLSASAEDERTVPRGKNYELYLRMLHAAWEDGQVDRGEALLLEVLREELGILTRQHFVLEHHPRVRPLWDFPKAFETARNHLLTTGVVLTHGEHYVIASQVCMAVRRIWKIELEDAEYERLLTHFTIVQLRKVSENAGLPLTGSKGERAQRIVEGLVAPAVALDQLHINEVKDLCRDCRLPVTAAKTDLIASLIEHFDEGADLVPEDPTPKEETVVEPEPEPRELDTETLTRLLQELTVDQLYDVLAAHHLRRSGSKGARIERLVASPWSEQTLLRTLPKGELVDLCRRHGLRVSGVKDDLIARLLGWANAVPSEKTPEGVPIPSEQETTAPDEGDSSAEGDSTEKGTPAEPSRPLPPGLRDIQVDYPNLEPGEQVVLALLKQVRSLTEVDIERAARHHDLRWVLVKAHMADLLATLDRRGPNPVRVRSTGSVNIYEWAGVTGDGPGALQRDAARDLVDALRQGVVPERHLEQLVVGQEAAREHLVKLLDHVRTGRSEFKFLRGPYGAGKSFLFSWFREQAFAKGFAVATVRVGPDQPISDLPVFYSGMVNGLRSPEKRDASALPDILESWLLAILRRIAEIEGVPPFGTSTRAILAPIVEQHIREELAHLADHDPSFPPAVLHFYKARVEGDRDTANTALAWLRGSRAMSGDALRRIGVRGHLEGEEVFPRMRALLHVIAGGRLSGLLLLVDELELVRRFPHARQRERAYETLRLLVDEAGENGLPGCLMVFTGTDALFEDERYGLASYEALANRVTSQKAIDGVVSMRQPVIQLEPLDASRLLAVAERVRAIHSLAYGWAARERVDDAVLAKLVEDATTFGGEATPRLPRPVLRELVHLLDICEENPGVRAADCVRTGDDSDLAASVIDIRGA